eukprot:gene6153-6859_t
MENKTLLVNDMQEFLRKRSEYELEYARNLERLADRFTDRCQKQRNIYGLPGKERAATVNLWCKLLKDTKYKAKSSASLGDVLAKNVAVRFNDLSEDIVRISRIVKETSTFLQDAIQRSLSRLQQAMKTYYMRHSEFVFAEEKLKETNMAKQKFEESPNKKGNEKKIKNFDRIRQKRELRYNDSRMKATRARNDYLIQMASTKATFNKYYDNDIGDIISKTDHNYHNSFTAALQAYCGSELRLANSFITAADSLSRSVGIVDPDNDRLMFLEDNQHAFVPDKKLEFQKRPIDKLSSITGTGALKKELESKFEEAHNALQTLKSDLAEVGDQIVQRKNALSDIYKQYDSELNAHHNIDMVHPLAPVISQSSSQHVGVSSQLRSNKEEMESGLLSKFKEFLLSENLNTGHQAVHDALSKALGEIAANQLKKHSGLIDSDSLYSLSGSMKGKPVKLFGTSLEYQYQQSGNDLPDIVESCVKFIKRFGLEHQGIFRVSGTSQEISDIKKSFEEGKDPLAGLNHWKDINAVAGVFRAYFRELKDPLFPSEYCMDYIKISRMSDKEEQISEIRRIFSHFPQLNTSIIKYLLKFLHLVSTKCDINKMNSHNLAVVFGPTLIRAPANEDLITNQGQINIFMEFFINEFFSVFPDEADAGTCDNLRDFTNEEDIEEEDEDTVDHTDDELGSDDEAEGDYFDAEALYDYTARSHKELSFKKGDIIMLFSRANNDWWEAQLNGVSGFVPVNYINIASSDADRLDISSEDSTTGITEVQMKPESSSEEPTLLEETALSSSNSPTKSKEGSQEPAVLSNQQQISGSLNNVFLSIDPTVKQSNDNAKSVTLGRPVTMPLTAPQPFQPRSSSLSKVGLAKKDSLNEPVPGSVDSLSSTVSAVREAFGVPKQPPSHAKVTPKSLVISPSDLRTTQSKLRPNTPDDVLSPRKDDPFAEALGASGGAGSFVLQKKGSVKDMSKMFGRHAVPPIRKATTSSTTSDDSAISPTTDRRMSVESTTDDHNDNGSKSAPAPAVKPKPKKKDSLSCSQSGSSELIATIKAAAVAKICKETTGDREETNL